MHDLVTQASGLTLVRDLVRFGVDDQPLRRGQSAVDLLRIRRGAYAHGQAWQEAKSLERYRMRVLAVVGTRRVAPILSHLSAAAVYGYPIVGAWPWPVDLLAAERSGIRSKNGVIVHRDAFVEQDVTEFAGLSVTSPARTLADLARALPFEAAVVMLDHALNPDHAHRMTLVTKDEVLACLEMTPTRRGQRAARRVVAFADGRSGSPGETRSRVAIYELGFPAPQLQVRHPSKRISYYEVDFEWPDYRQVGEFDGAGKYLKEELRNGKDVAQIMYEEKLREDELRGQGNGMTRWGWPELEDRATLRAMLLNAGLPIVARRLPEGDWR